MKTQAQTARKILNLCPPQATSHHLLVTKCLYGKLFRCPPEHSLSRYNTGFPDTRKLMTSESKKYIIVLVYGTHMMGQVLLGGVSNISSEIIL